MPWLLLRFSGRRKYLLHMIVIKCHSTFEYFKKFSHLTCCEIPKSHNRVRASGQLKTTKNNKRKCASVHFWLRGLMTIEGGSGVPSTLQEVQHVLPYIKLSVTCSAHLRLTGVEVVDPAVLSIIANDEELWMITFKKHNGHIGILFKK